MTEGKRTEGKSKSKSKRSIAGEGPRDTLARGNPRGRTEARARKLVVAGLIVGADDQILITQRRADQALGGWWEFPGGKVEPGEAPVDALVRELREEIGVTVAVGRIWDVVFHAYPEFDLVMLVYVCRIVAKPEEESPRAVEVADLAWVAAGELAAWDILPADRPLVDRLRAEGVPPN